MDISQLATQKNFTLKSGLSKTQGTKVVNALMKVQDKLSSLEVKLNSKSTEELDKIRDAQSARASATSNDDANEHRSSGNPSPIANSPPTGQPESLTFDVVNCRLQLIERKLDALTQIFINNTGPAFALTVDEQAPTKIKLQIKDDSAKKIFIKNHFRELMYSLQEEYDFINYELNMLRKRPSCADVDIQKQIYFVEKKKIIKEKQIVELSMLAEEFETMNVAEHFTDLWSHESKHGGVLRKPGRRTKPVPVLPKWR